MGQYSGAGSTGGMGKGAQQPPNPQLGAMQQIITRNAGSGNFAPPTASGGAMTPQDPGALRTFDLRPGDMGAPRDMGAGPQGSSAPDFRGLFQRMGVMNSGGGGMGGMDSGAVGLRDPNAGGGFMGRMTPMGPGGPIASMPGQMNIGMGMPDTRRIMPAPMTGPGSGPQSGRQIQPGDRMTFANLLRGNRGGMSR